MQVQRGYAAASDGVGGNGAHLFETFGTGRGLVERNTVKNSRIVNNLFIGPKGVAQNYECRANDLSKDNAGSFHLRSVARGAIDGEAFANRGTTNSVILCYKKAGNPVTNTEGKVNFGNTTTPRPPYNFDWIMYRNSQCGPIDRLREHEPTIATAARNICWSVEAGYNDIDNVKMIGLNRSDFFDANMNLIGAARAQHLGIRGAEIA